MLPDPPSPAQAPSARGSTRTAARLSEFRNMQPVVRTATPPAFRTSGPELESHFWRRADILPLAPASRLSDDNSVISDGLAECFGRPGVQTLKSGCRIGSIGNRRYA